MPNGWAELFVAGMVSYLLGSIPSGVLLARLFGWPDPRTYGSGHTGGLNVSRGAGKRALVIVMLADVLKGLAAVLAALHLSANPWAIPVAGMAVVAGHNWPLWLRFKGGMGLSTALGATITLIWPVVLAAATLLVVVRFLLIRHTPRAAIIALLVVPPMLWLLRYPPALFWSGTGIVALLIARHAADWNRNYEDAALSR
jgi:glycerol-3-phosphate acyltransferase PlsY